MAQDEQKERLRRLRAARSNASVRFEPTSGSYMSPEGFAPPPIAPPGRQGHGGALIALLVLCLIAGAGIAGVSYALHQFHSAVGGPKRTVEFTVRPGEGVSTIADSLQKQGLVSSALLFQLYYRINGGSEHIHAGKHRLNSTMSIDTIVSQLQQPTYQPPSQPTVVARGAVKNGFPITLLPGKRMEEIGQLLQKYGIVSAAAFEREVRHGRFHYWFLRARPRGASVEGFLYPVTNLIVIRKDDPHRIVNAMLAEFGRRFRPALHMAAARAHRSVFQIVTMASIVQRESVNRKDLPYIAGVYWNRLSNIDEVNGKLYADPTVQYAMGYRKDERTWWEKLPKFIDTSIDSPYNTYKVQGLPPGPISNPGMEALLATLHPARSNYLYFQVLSKDRGKTYHTYFCTTLLCQTNQSGVRIN